MTASTMSKSLEISEVIFYRDGESMQRLTEVIQELGMNYTYNSETGNFTVDETPIRLGDVVTVFVYPQEYGPGGAIVANTPVSFVENQIKYFKSRNA